MKFGNQKAASNEEKCELFADFLQHTYANDEWVPSDPGPETCLDLPPFHFSVEEFDRALLELETNKGAGLDGIPPIILKNCATAFVLPLCLIFNNTISTCVFPDK
jgi:hypothetical protein